MLGIGVQSRLVLTMTRFFFTLIINFMCFFVAWNTTKGNSNSCQVFSNISILSVARVAVFLYGFVDFFSNAFVSRIKVYGTPVPNGNKTLKARITDSSSSSNGYHGGAGEYLACDRASLRRISGIKGSICGNL